MIRYGLGAVLLGAAVEGDFTLILGSVVSHLGYFPFSLAVAAGALGTAQLIASRFVYGTKSASMVFWELHGLPLHRFAAVDGAGCVLGALVFTGLGYLASGSATVLLGRVRRVEFWLLGGLVVGVALVVIIHRTAKWELHIDDGADTSG